MLSLTHADEIDDFHDEDCVLSGWNMADDDDDDDDDVHVHDHDHDNDQEKLKHETLTVRDRVQF